MKPQRVAVPLWFVLAMLASVAAIAALMVFIVADSTPTPTVTTEEVGDD